MSKKTFLDFETPIAELENKIEELRYVQTESAVDISAEITQLAKKSQQLTKDIYSDLTPWQITKIARHAERPYTHGLCERDVHPFCRAARRPPFCRRPQHRRRPGALQRHAVHGDRPAKRARHQASAPPATSA